jgi:NAD(P)-dependent dehydrogenase (short-subunit alcohol dehydrogenase family)
MEQVLKGRRLIVTGAASGIGHATAIELAARGASIALWDLDAAAVEAAAASIRAGEGARCIGLRADVSSEAEVVAATQRSIDALGGLDGAFNNAGVGAPTVTVDAIAERDFDRIVSINLKGVWLCLKHQIRHLRANGGGSIVNNASVSGLVALAGQGAYTAAKHGVVGLSKTAAVECAAAGIRVNAICPGAVRTPILRHLEQAGITETALASMSPQARIADPREIAAAVVWLLSPQSSFVTGAAVPIDGGWSAQ